MRDVIVHEARLPRLPIPLDPFEAFRKLRGAGPAVLLDAPLASTEPSRAYVLFDPVAVVRLPARSDASHPGLDPFALLEREVAAVGRAAPPQPGGGDPLPRFRGGAAGFLGFDLGRHVERLPSTARCDTAVPDLWMGIFDRGLEIDVATGEVVSFVVENARRSGRRFVADAFADAAARLAAPVPAAAGFAASELRSNFGRDAYVRAVEAVREYVRSGDAYQVNLSQRFEASFEGSADAVYARLRSGNPAPFAACVDALECRVLSSSPELFLARSGRRVETRPIKGTRRRTGDPAADAALERELLASEKEVAELSMVIDLERNDLSRVSEVGSVEVVDAGRLERYATVVHRTAVVGSRLEPGRTAADLLRATFPGGSVTGVPKIRALELIEELEGLRRGVFTGAIGFLGFDGGMALNVAIRTIAIEAGRAHFHVGGGIVLDSDPAAEYEETLVKGDALARALGRGGLA